MKVISQKFLCFHWCFIFKVTKKNHTLRYVFNFKVLYQYTQINQYFPNLLGIIKLITFQGKRLNFLIWEDVLPNSQVIIYSSIVITFSAIHSIRHLPLKNKFQTSQDKPTLDQPEQDNHASNQPNRTPRNMVLPNSRRFDVITSTITPIPIIRSITLLFQTKYIKNSQVGIIKSLVS